LIAGRIRKCIYRASAAGQVQAAPVSVVWKRGGVQPLTGVGFWESPWVPSLVLDFRTSNLPLLPVWEKGVGG